MGREYTERHSIELLRYFKFRCRVHNDVLRTLRQYSDADAGCMGNRNRDRLLENETKSTIKKCINRY